MVVAAVDAIGQTRLTRCIRPGDSENLARAHVQAHIRQRAGSADSERHLANAKLGFVARHLRRGFFLWAAIS